MLCKGKESATAGPRAATRLSRERYCSAEAPTAPWPATPRSELPFESVPMNGGNGKRIATVRADLSALSQLLPMVLSQPRATLMADWEMLTLPPTAVQVIVPNVGDA